MMGQSTVQIDDSILGSPILVHWSSKALGGQTPLDVHLSTQIFVYFDLVLPLVHFSCSSSFNVLHDLPPGVNI